ncbi:hypothetical protein [Nonomuraea sp. SBT364]|uniref:hypothetical protein n=1 Tax=Nonomuraea sp. SBT364 TaxID=1580530 RepID=UPI00066DCFC4|nr:hypothetical protein [Nonomuraea sp. SBT364]
MTNPKHARDTDNGRYYQDPAGGLLVSVTNVLNTLNKPALAPAAAKVTAEYFAENLPTAVRASRNPAAMEDFIKAAKAEHKNVWETRRDLGSRVHALAEAHVLGTPAEHDEEAQPFVDQYELFLKEFGVDIATDIDAVEVTVLHRSYRYGGTADLWIRLKNLPGGQPDGLWLVDIKTSLTKSASTVYRDHALQLAALRFAEVALAPDDSEHPVPEFAGAAILNLRTSSYGFVPMPALPELHSAFVGLLTASYVLHDLDMKPYKPLNTPARKPRTRKAAA